MLENVLVAYSKAPVKEETKWLRGEGDEIRLVG